MAGEGTKRIIDLTEAAETQSGDYIAIDSTGRGTRKLPAGFMATAEDLSEEQTARETADATLDGKITAEAQARLDADNAIDEQITALDEKTEADASLIQNPTKTLSGALCSFTDGADMPMVACSAEIVPKQSGTGTPSPDNVRTISGWESVNVFDTGVNVWDEETELGGLIWASGEPLSANDRLRSKNFSPCVPSTEYHVFNGRAGSVSIAVFFYDASQAFISYTVNTDFTTPSNAHYFKLVIQNTTSYNNDISINYPSTDTEYHAYNPNSATTTVNLGRTVYGGTLDVVSGELTVDKGFATFDGSSDETWFNNGSVGVYTPKASLPNVKTNAGMLSNQYVRIGAGEAPRTNGQLCWNSNYTALQFRNDNALNATDFRAALTQNPVTIVYELATPQTYQLTPTEIQTLLGDNNVWADSGDVEITYRRDISIVINNLESALNG